MLSGNWLNSRCTEQQLINLCCWYTTQLHQNRNWYTQKLHQQQLWTHKAASQKVVDNLNRKPHRTAVGSFRELTLSKWHPWQHFLARQEILLSCICRRLFQARGGFNHCSSTDNKASFRRHLWNLQRMIIDCNNRSSRWDQIYLGRDFTSLLWLRLHNHHAGTSCANSATGKCLMRVCHWADNWKNFTLVSSMPSMVTEMKENKNELEQTSLGSF